MTKRLGTYLVFVFIFVLKKTQATPLDDQDWSEVIELPVRDYSYTIPNLNEGNEVSFRIRAINALGPSEPSRSTDTITIQDQPRI
ncbi:unnamed protein product [Adineta steineri]|uniref:Fibronectin type-III domain-containing protein n=1 Tax=Adineta steineri TaxID=433720 RepID=A0A814H3W9_9BILA|nr:unnamed protein product [Adineta steineri]CAF3599629.1 unnamed protein product [Adineta steineri]